MRETIKKIGLGLGFSRVGITAADPIDELGNLEESIKYGRNASMGWLARAPERRVDPSSLLKGAKSVICCALSYGEDGIEVSTPSEEVDIERVSRVARYARGADYHDVIRAKLKDFWSKVKEEYSGARAKLCVDTSPILEKALAERAGIGWIGKHTILVNEDIGSWFLLGEIITDLEIEPDLPAKNRCGDCTACIDACPTSAILSPNVLDARRCISYLTVEAPRSALKVSGQDSKGCDDKYSYGCDICQEVCPYNRRG